MRIDVNLSAVRRCAYLLAFRETNVAIFNESTPLPGDPLTKAQVCSQWCRNDVREKTSGSREVDRTRQVHSITTELSISATTVNAVGKHRPSKPLQRPSATDFAVQGSRQFLCRAAVSSPPQRPMGREETFKSDRRRFVLLGVPSSELWRCLPRNCATIPSTILDVGMVVVICSKRDVSKAAQRGSLGFLSKRVKWVRLGNVALTRRMENSPSVFKRFGSSRSAEESESVSVSDVAASCSQNVLRLAKLEKVKVHTIPGNKLRGKRLSKPFSSPLGGTASAVPLPIV